MSAPGQENIRWMVGRATALPKPLLDMVSQVAALELEKKKQKQKRFKVFALAPGVVDT